MISMDVKSSDSISPVGYDDCPRIYLSDEQVKTLGITGVPMPGTGVKLVCLAVVDSVRAENEPEEKDGKPAVYLTLKITDMEATQPTKPADLAAGLYK